VELSGSPGARGRHHGELLAREIRVMRLAALKYLGKITLYVGAWPLYAFLKGLSRRFQPYLTPDLNEELQAMAEGARLPRATLLLINCLDDLANNIPRCSALAVGERLTFKGRYLAGRNLDYPLFTEVLLPLQTLFQVTPEQGIPYVSLAWPGYLGVSTGLNRAGVALAQLSVMSRKTTIRGMPAALRYRQALEKGDTAMAVARRVLDQPGTIGNNLLICAPREAVVLELAPSRFFARRPVAGLLTVTNHFQSLAMSAVQGAFSRRPPYSVLDPQHFTEAYSKARDAKLRELAAAGPLTPKDLQKILGHPQIANPGTVNSVVFDPERLTLWVATHDKTPVSRGRFVELKPWS
jgi:hypothetical protein